MWGYNSHISTEPFEVSKQHLFHKINKFSTVNAGCFSGGLLQQKLYFRVKVIFFFFSSQHWWCLSVRLFLCLHRSWGGEKRKAQQNKRNGVVSYTSAEDFNPVGVGSGRDCQTGPSSSFFRQQNIKVSYFQFFPWILSPFLQNITQTLSPSVVDQRRLAATSLRSLSSTLSRGSLPVVHLLLCCFHH